MCGLFGYFSPKRQEVWLERLEPLARLADTRGGHGWGFVAIRHAHLSNLRDERTPAWNIVRETKRYEECPERLYLAAGAHIVVGHCRLATTGEDLNNENDYQPIVNEFAVAHNGVVENAPAMATKHGLTLHTKNDSEVVERAIAKATGSLPERLADAWKTLTLSGNHALLAASDHRLVAFRRGHPLFVARDPDGFYFCSREFEGSEPLTDGRIFAPFENHTKIQYPKTRIRHR